MPQAPQNVALVTGAARGIGLATAKKFLAEGWRVALLDIEGELQAGATAALKNPDNTLAITCDVSDATAVGAAMAAVMSRFGRLDALVNNAGVAVFAPVLETSDADWNRIMAVNLTGPFLCTKAAAPLMREQGGGAIVNVTSISAVRASTLRSAYGTSKAGLAHLTKQLAVELASLNIRVNAVAPGPVDTAMAKQVHSREIRADYHDAIPPQPLRPGGGTRRSDLFPVLGTIELHHRPNFGRRWRLRCGWHRPADAARRTAERVNVVGWAKARKRRAHLPSRFAMPLVGTLRFAHPTGSS
ncbi:NAD(P)-dependent dehydrogenase (short-subunit alcohol dehydrogenase family) [Bradyrhizobium sp. i1.3.1]